MCGLAFIRHGGAVPANIASRIAKTKAALANRGPDGHGIESTPDATLIHYRLAIVGGEEGKQPLWSADKSHVILFNGEIYNYKAIRASLASCGVFMSVDCSDTEVLLSAYIQWGESIFSQVDGMFACVIYQPGKDKIVVACDRYGIKPLFFSGEENSLTFSSTLESNIALSGMAEQSPDAMAIDQLLRVGFNFAGHTFHPKIKQLQPGRYQKYLHGKLVEEACYWAPDSAMSACYTRISVQDTEQLIEQAMKSQWCEQRPSGIFLSSGVDSAIIKHFFQKKTSHYYTASFDGVKNDEWSILRDMGVSSQRILCNETNVINPELLLRLYDAPFSDNAALPTYLMGKQAKNDVRIIYSGDGADELFLGYRNHRLLQLENCVNQNTPAWLRERLIEFARSSLAQKTRTRSTLLTLQRTWANSYTDAMSHIGRNDLSALYTPSMRAQANTDTLIESMEKSLNVDCPVKRIQALDWMIYLPGSVLTKVDRATMQNGVEARVPFLSNLMVDHFIQAPHRDMMSFTTGKLPLRRVANKIGAGGQQKKRAFINPIHIWLKRQSPDALKKRIMQDSLMSLGWFCPNKIVELIDRFFKGENHLAKTLWSLILLTTYCTEKEF